MRQSLSRKFHPKTGVELHPIMFRRDGRPVWPILGASPDDDSNPDESEREADDEVDDSPDDEESKSGDKDKDPRVKELSDEAARRRVENKKLKGDLEAAQKRLREIDDQDKSEVDRLTARVAELEAQDTERASALYEARIHNAFLASSKHEWHSPERALKLADLSEVEIDDDGKVTGLDKALDALAKSDPYLLKGKSDDGDDSSSRGRSGTPAGSGKDKDKGALDRERLMKKYPVLSR